MKFKLFVLVLLASELFIACQNDNRENKAHSLQKVKLETNFGFIVIELYDETPIHRDNFIKIVQDGVLDSLLFHRVIQNFVIQSGDTDSKHAQPGENLGDGGLPYLMDAEIKPELYHKRGAVGMARDDHPLKASHSTQFYIVQGKIANDSLLDVATERINKWKAKTEFLKLPKNEELLQKMVWAFEKDTALFKTLNDSVSAISKTFEDFEHYFIPQEHVESYKSFGGIPHLDQNYTVFGEIVEGMNIVDSIASESTDKRDIPISDIRILKANVLKLQ